MYYSNGIKTKWISSVESIFQECGMYNIWLSHNSNNKTWLVKSIKQKLCDQFLQKWHSDCCNSSRGISYSLFTNFDFKLQDYLSSELTFNSIVTLTEFRCSNHRLPIETGCWNKVPSDERKCNLCHNDLGDEFHYILCCKALSKERNVFIPSYFSRYPNTLNFFTLFNSKQISLQIKLCKFIKVIMERIGPLGWNVYTAVYIYSLIHVLYLYVMQWEK